MSTIEGDAFTQGALTHYGVKGMKWGVRKPPNAPPGPASKVTTKTGHTKSGKVKVETSGGERQPAHSDAVKAAESKQKLKKSGIDALSNKELQDLQTRLNLEQNVSRLAAADAQQRMSAGQKFIKSLQGDLQRDVQRSAAQEVTKQVSKLLMKK